MGFFDSVSSLASAASPVTNLIPGGGIANAAIGLGSKLGAFLSGKGGVPDHERPDLVSISNVTGLTQQQVSDLCGMEEKRSPDNYDAIVKKYAGNPNGLLPLVDEWNAANPSKKIVTLDSITPAAVPASVVQVPAALTASSVPAVVQQSLTSSPSVASNLTGTDVKDLGKAVIGGAQQGATDWYMKTPSGMQAKADGALSWAKDNFLIFLGAGIALGLLVYKAFSKK